MYKFVNEIKKYFAVRQNVEVIKTRKYFEGYQAGISENAKEIQLLTTRLRVMISQSIDDSTNFTTRQKNSLQDLSDQWNEQTKDISKKIESTLKNSTKKINEIHDDHFNDIENLKKKFDDNCNACKIKMDAERNKLNELKNKYEKVIEDFGEIYKKLLLFIEINQEGIDAICKLGAGKHQLSNVKNEFKQFILENNKLINGIEKE